MLTTRNIATQFTDWNLAQCKAYQAGAKAGLRGMTIKEGFEYDTEDDGDDDLTLFFFRGYADAVGPSCEGEDWYDEISDWRISQEWWDGE